MAEQGPPPGGSGSGKQPSIYAKLDALCEEMSGDIRSAAQRAGEDAVAVSTSLAKLRERAYLDRAPEAQHVALLFRKYKDVHSSSSRLDPSGSQSPHGGVTATAALPNWLRTVPVPLPRVPDDLLDGTAEQLVGPSATGKNIFRLRAAASLVSMISFSIMASAPYIHYPNPSASDMFVPNCMYSYTKVTGSFDFTPYQAALASGVLIFVHSIVFVAYYLLPVDANGHKHVPFLERVFEPCSVDVSTVHGASSRVSMFCAAQSKLIEALVDGGLVIFNLATLLAASIAVERGAKFDFGGGVSTWYTLGTFTLTFQGTSPPCVAQNNDPSQKIRASLAFLYLCLFVQTLTLMVSMRSYAKEKLLRGDGSGGGGSSAGSAPGTGAYDKRSLVANTDPDDEEGVVEVSL